MILIHGMGRMGQEVLCTFLSAGIKDRFVERTGRTLKQRTIGNMLNVKTV
jgi:hypothetical protein